MQEITSRDNVRLRFARAVGREKERNHVFLEGKRIVREAITGDISFSDIFVSSDFDGLDSIPNLGPRRDYVRILSPKLFKSIALTKSPQGIAAVCEKPRSGRPLLEEMIRNCRSAPLLLMLHEINNPNNLGAIVRTAEAGGVDAIITTSNSANPFSPKSIRASMGSVLRVPVWEGAVFDEGVDWSVENGLSTIGAAASSAKTYSETDWRRPTLLVFGSEAHGLSDEEIAKLEESVCLPMKNGVESLNIAVSSGIFIYEIMRQRGGP